ncbi:MAG: class I SAM-dependent methyltransferase [Longimicrobiales bacterium]
MDASLAASTQAVYERQAKRFDAERPKSLHEQAWLDRFLAMVEPRGRVLDLGCGGGDPIAAYMMERGFEVVGVDASEAMLAIARGRFPEGDWRNADMRRLNLPESFHGIIAWDSFFHLMAEEQRSVLPRLAGHMTEGAALLLTVGPEAGEVGGWVGGEAVYHASLAPAEYEALLHELGVEIQEFVPDDPSCDGHTILLAKKSLARAGD